MNTSPGKDQLPTQEKPFPQNAPAEKKPIEFERNIADGGEFLDDGIRMKEQPFDQKRGGRKEDGELAGFYESC